MNAFSGVCKLHTHTHIHTQKNPVTDDGSVGSEYTISLNSYQSHTTYTRRIPNNYYQNIWKRTNNNKRQMTDHKKSRWNRMKISNRTLLLFTSYSELLLSDYSISKIYFVIVYSILIHKNTCHGGQQNIYSQLTFIFTKSRYLRCAQYHTQINHNVLRQILTNLFSLVMSIQQYTSQRNAL